MTYRLRKDIKFWLLPMLFTASLSDFTASLAKADDWPHWNGPTWTGEYFEKGTLKAIPADGLKKLWSKKVGMGYAGPSIVKGQVYVADYQMTSGTVTNNPGGRDRLNGTERLQCLDAVTGEQRWSYAYEREYNLSYPSGPRATPTVDGDRVYFLGAEGDLACLDTKTGVVIWKRQIKEDYRTQPPIWGYAAAPFIHEELLYVLAGGSGSIVVALDKMTGSERWRALSSNDIGYCPPTILKAAGAEQLLVWEPQKLHSLNPKTGEEYWNYEIKPKYEMSIIPPVVHGNRMYISGIGEIGAMLEIDSKKPGVKELWKGKTKLALYSANGTPVFDGEYVYGADCGSGSLICFRATDGERIWETFKPTGGGDRRISHGTAFLNKVGDLYYIFSETGDFIIARLTAENYDEIGRFHILEPTNESFGRPVVWSYPAYANRCLYARNDQEIVCYSIAEPEKETDIGENFDR